MPEPSWIFRDGHAPPRIIRCGAGEAGVRHIEALARGGGPCIGYIAYEAGRLFERLPTTARDDLGLPVLALMDFTRAGDVPASAPIATCRPLRRESEIRSTFTRDSYIAAVERAIDYIAAGDVFQVNLSQRFTVPLRDEPWTIYQRLRAAAPALYGAYLDFGDFQLISNSPELFLRVMPLPDGRRRVITRPIKGTRPRGPGQREALLASVKDQAELNMIVDLERNDLGRVCEIGSVRVTERRTIETHPTVYHGVATIEGLLRPDVTFADLLAATFPGGSVTGAPKIRAMQIIDELEPVQRGPYCGAIGFIAADGSIEFNLAIRTMIVKDGLVHIPVGGGIVADSDPVAEYEETLVKARAMFDALNVSPRDIAEIERQS
jgi:para-aminobenzoate synthetase component 1